MQLPISHSLDTKARLAIEANLGTALELDLGALTGVDILEFDVGFEKLNSSRHFTLQQKIITPKMLHIEI